MSDKRGLQERRSSDERIDWGLNRRQWLQGLTASVISYSLLDTLTIHTAQAAQGAVPRNGFPRMVQEYFVHQVRRANSLNVQRYQSLSTQAEAEAYVAEVRQKIQTCFGPPPERTDLNPRVTGVVERDAYRIEKLIFDSRPGFPVTANLYIPKNTEFPRPGVVGTCGHSINGKGEKAYQSFAQGLARLGYVCLIYDPIGQGERLQYVKDDLTSRIGVGVREHLYAGNQQFLVGEFLGMWCAWDGIRALDYLLTRPEVDAQQVGVTGNSGGGTMTTWLCGVEQRWTMAAPSCFVTSFRRNMENELPADTEQCPPKALALGLDHCDFLAAQAPDPVMILAKQRDFFDIRGSYEALGRLKHLYELLGHKQNVSMFAGPTPHGFSQENREAMYGWFNKATANEQGSIEPDLTIEEDETLWCTPQGQVAAMEGTRSVFDFTRDKSQQLAKQRKPLEGTALLEAVAQVLKIRPASQGAKSEPDRPPAFRILRSHRNKSYPLPYACPYAVQSEPGMMAIVYMLSKEFWESRPPRSDGRAVLYVAHRSSADELQSEPLIREILEQEPASRLFTCDVRGVGESTPNTCGDNTFDDAYGCDFFYAIHSLMLDRPYLGQKTWDVLQTLRFLAAFGYRDVHLVGKGWGSLAATFAALSAPEVTQVTLKNALESYSCVAESEEYNWPLATLLPSVLAYFDLPDCYRALEAKKLRQIEPWGALGEQKDGQTES